MIVPTLSVSFADSSPKGRAKELLQIGTAAKTVGAAKIKTRPGDGTPGAFVRLPFVCNFNKGVENEKREAAYTK